MGIELLLDRCGIHVRRVCRKVLERWRKDVGYVWERCGVGVGRLQ